jgi:hypothetical protein
MRTANITSAMSALAAGFVQRALPGSLDRDHSGQVTAREITQSGVLTGPAVQAVGSAPELSAQTRGSSSHGEPVSAPATQLAVERLLAEQTLAAVVGMMVPAPHEPPAEPVQPSAQPEPTPQSP